MEARHDKAHRVQAGCEPPAINPFFHQVEEARPGRALPPPLRDPSGWARLPQAPETGSPVPHLTSLYHRDDPGPYGSRSWPGNSPGNLVKDLLRFHGAANCFDPMSGSGTCKDVCRELGIYCWSGDIHQGFDACAPSPFQDAFSFAWLHPPYWKMKLYSSDPRDLSRCPTLGSFLERYALAITNCRDALVPGGTLAILMGDYQDREAGFVPLAWWTKKLAFDAGMRQCATDIIRFSHGASSGRKSYRSSFIPGLHDTCMLFRKEGA